RKATGLANSLLATETARPTEIRRVVEVAPGAADGASGLPPTRAAGGTVRRSPRPASAPRSAAPARRAGAASPATGGRASRAAADPTWVSAEGLARMRDELAELTQIRRPDVIGRIKAAKELGDLKENADYTAAREEQSFLEGRIAAIEETLRRATVIDTADDDHERVTVGSTVTIEGEDASQSTFTIVGSTEADPSAGRISNVSPVGRALVGATVGQDVAVTTPRGQVRYRVVAIA
ncbi:MAG TPA: transcription elongation factor GreA, partial [Candidatus Limnocylindrales bacterium]|nr:transcription elongation factor GreA [Candidatus Limnocylindrales bacterium]